ncbi:hypothetical protein KM176_24155 [Pseudooceanicola sp. CBS1P-1]|uniref:Uncharacterized protein n=1 Tax=Pseudooceanicola albus TaxID=2692189 RepID=A0A6L7GBK0_9RHOB|nr:MULTISPECIES: hypothetical protein [Pseudooceanicola]MBT9386957.1 hypothetical protein [Pseudooceanicola endophyticus]MXN21082.1 hypothetical protein [Pseudooceanicola albus]
MSRHPARSPCTASPAALDQIACDDLNCLWLCWRTSVDHRAGAFANEGTCIATQVIKDQSHITVSGNADTKAGQVIRLGPSFNTALESERSHRISENACCTVRYPAVKISAFPDTRARCRFGPERPRPAAKITKRIMLG